MRPIKFRAWNKHVKKMLYRVELAYDMMRCHCKVEHDGGCDNGLMSFDDVLDDDNYIPMQYTGLKDKHGKEIYEGDIVKDFKGIAVVHYVPPGFQCWDKPRKGWWLGGGNAYGQDSPQLTGTEIIGNIHENKELL